MYFSSITDLEIKDNTVELTNKECDVKDYDNQIEVFKVIMRKLTIPGSDISESGKNALEELGALEEVETIFKIIDHPAPQNRPTDDLEYGSDDDPDINYVRYYDHERRGYETEAKGLLSLTSKDKVGEDPITKEDVLDFLSICVVDILYNLRERRKVQEELEQLIAANQETDNENIESTTAVVLQDDEQAMNFEESISDQIMRTFDELMGYRAINGENI